MVIFTDFAVNVRRIHAADREIKNKNKSEFAGGWYL